MTYKDVYKMVKNAYWADWTPPAMYRTGGGAVAAPTYRYRGNQANNLAGRAVSLPKALPSPLGLPVTASVQAAARANAGNAVGAGAKKGASGASMRNLVNGYNRPSSAAGAKKPATQSFAQRTLGSLRNGFKGATKGIQSYLTRQRMDNFANNVGSAAWNVVAPGLGEDIVGEINSAILGGKNPVHQEVQDRYWRTHWMDGGL